MAELGAVAEDGLKTKGVGEKGYSVGRFEPSYLRRFDIAVVRRAGAVVAFANLWRGAPGTAVSVDLMRHSGDAPPYAMDFLLARLLLWARDQRSEARRVGKERVSTVGSRWVPAF